MSQEYIEIKGAKVHNLKNISVKIPKNKFVVFTGVSGSGKSSLAFDTLYAEGQRRYVESLSSYARQFLGLMEKPDVESITGLSPAISIDQKTSSSNPRSTVGTVTEIYDYLRLLYARIGQTYCPNCGILVQSQSVDEIVSQIINEICSQPSRGTKLQVLSPLIKSKKGQYSELFERLLSKGFLRVRVDNEVYNLDEIEETKINKFEKHDIDLIIDRLAVPENFNAKNDDEETKNFLKRLRDSIELAGNMSDGEIKLLIDEKEHFYSEKNTCTKCGISFPEITPASFSFNAPQGACPKCSGMGFLKEIDLSKIYNPNLSIAEGGIFPWSSRTTTDSWTYRILESVAKKHGFNLQTKIKDYSPEIFDLIFYGVGVLPKYTIEYTNRFGQKRLHETIYEGVVPEMERRYRETTSEYSRFETEKYMIENICSECHGKRLRPSSLAVRINDVNIDEISSQQIQSTLQFFENIKLTGMKAEIANPIIREVCTRLKFLVNVGLNYLSLSRRANTLSGGESQRIRLASQIGTALTGVLYVLDEPSIGLHSRDVSNLINTLFSLRDLGNSVVVVEHDYETMSHADWILDIGPLAGENGGDVVGNGTFNDIKQLNTLTANYLSRRLVVGQEITDQKTSLLPTEEKATNIAINGVQTHNLKDINVKIPLGKFVCITGVSGSGKSSLINDTLYPALKDYVNNRYSLKEEEKNNSSEENEESNNLPSESKYKEITGMENVTKVIEIDQSPIGRTPRSNPVTYTGVFNYIRDIFAHTQEARARGYTSGRFSFNVKGGRCETCRGEGQIKIEMQFLPDMYVTCETCHGKRYNEDALQIDFKGKNIAQVLDMTISEALDFFQNIPQIYRKLKLLDEVGLGYIRLGQPAPTLSGGESQRIKLARELSKVTRGHTVYILDEPTTGLHFYDVDKLLSVLYRLVQKGNTVLVIEHNLDVIKLADWIIDLGPEGGDKGGEVVVEGTVEDVMKCHKSWTGKYLKEYLVSGKIGNPKK